MLRNAWSKLGKMTKEEAMRAYLKALQKTDPSFKVDEKIKAKL